MPKTWVAQAVRGIEICRFLPDNAGNITALMVSGEVSDGESWRPRAEDIWPDLTVTQKTQMQALYTKLKTAYQNRMLA